MVRVHHCYRFVSQKVFSSTSEPTRGLSATADGLVLVATCDRRVQVFRILEDRVDSVGEFSTIALVEQVRMSDVFDYTVTLEEKSFQTFVRVYFGWRRHVERGVDSPGDFGDDDDGSEKSRRSSVRVKLAVDVLDDDTVVAESPRFPASTASPPPARPRQNSNRLEIVEVALKDHASAVATCPINGDLGVAVNRSVYLYRVDPSASSSRNSSVTSPTSPSPTPVSCMVSLKFILNLDQVASDVALSHPFVGVVYSTAEIKVFRIQAIDGDDDDDDAKDVEDSLQENLTSRHSKTFVSTRSSRTRRPRPVADYDLSADGALDVEANDGVSLRAKPTVNASYSLIHLRRPNADYASIDAPTSSLREVILKPAVAQERQYEGTENFDMIDLETLEGFRSPATASSDDNADSPNRLLSSDKSLKPSLCLYKSFKDQPRPHAVDASASSPAPASKLTFFRRADTPASLFCLVSGVKEGYLYSLPVQSASLDGRGSDPYGFSVDDVVGGRRSRLLATYPFTSPPLGFFSDGVILHALTDNGLESFPCRSHVQTLIDVAVGRRGEGLEDDDDDEEERAAAKHVFPPEEVCLLGLASFIGVSGVTFCLGHVILLSKSGGGGGGGGFGGRRSSKDPVDDSWSLYALKEAPIVELHGELTTLAKRYKRVSAPIYANLLRETLFLLLSAAPTISKTEKDGESSATEALDAAIGDALLRCFRLNVEDIFDEAAANAVAFHLRRRLTLQQILKHCDRVVKSVRARGENGATADKTMDFIRRLVVDLCRRKIPNSSSPFTNETASFDPDILELIVSSHLKTDRVETLSKLCCVGFLDRESLTKRPDVKKAIEAATGSSSSTNLGKSAESNVDTCSQLLFCLEKEGVERDAALARLDPRILVRECLTTPAIVFERSSAQCGGSSLMALSQYGRLLFRHRLLDFAAILKRLVQTEKIDVSSVIETLTEELPSVARAALLEHLRLYADDADGRLFLRPLLKIYFAGWENGSVEVDAPTADAIFASATELANNGGVRRRPNWLNRLAPFNGANPAFAPCRNKEELETNVSDGIEPVAEPCPCENCNVALIRIQALLADPTLTADDMLELAKDFPSLTSGADFSSAKSQSNELPSLRLLFLFKVDFRRGVEMMRETNSGALIDHCLEICADDSEKWEAVIRVLIDAEVADANLSAMDSRWNEVLRVAAVSLDKANFLKVLPKEANLRFLSPFLLLNHNLARVRISLAQASSSQ